MSGIDVIVPTLDGRKLLAKCLERLRAQSVSHQTIVVDNASSDGSAEMVEMDYPEVKLVRLENNLGYGGAVNAGVAAGEGDAVVVINNDVFCEPHFIEEMVKPLDGARKVGMVAGLLLEPTNGLVDSFGIEVDRTLAAYNRLWLEKRERALEEPATPVLGPNGGAAAYLRAAFEQVGGFDRRLFAYHEDVDLDLRLRLAGWSAALAPTAVAIHLGGATAGLGSRRQLELSSFGRWFTMRRYGVLRPTLRGAYAFLLEGAAAFAKAAIKRSPAILRACLAGWRAAGHPQSLLPAGVVNPQIGLLERLRRSRASMRSFRAS